MITIQGVKCKVNKQNSKERGQFLWMDKESREDFTVGVTDKLKSKFRLNKEDTEHMLSSRGLPFIPAHIDSTDRYQPTPRSAKD